tara:strand:- start:7102 stop:8103 length:1002 start_codon:yes stop_codon:yes gene_type:complete
MFSWSVMAAETIPLIERPETNDFIQHMIKKHRFNETELTSWLKDAKIQPQIIQSMSKPAEGLPWYKYKNIFLKDSRIQAGVEFWKNNKDVLAAAHKKYGVPEEIIIAILGVETYYGKYAGKDRVIDSLVTLSFDYPPRSKFFKSELEQFLLLSREEKWDPTVIKGSYAGAMGQPQFISSSYRHYAVDFNKNGKRDLLNSIEDSIGSIANYFKRSGWQKNEPVVFPATVSGEAYKNIKTSRSSPKPTYNLKEMEKSGITLKEGVPADKKLMKEKFALVSLEEKNETEHWLALQNFYVITRYNRSSLYAMAVHELSQSIKTAYNSSNAETDSSNI